MTNRINTLEMRDKTMKDSKKALMDDIKNSDALQVSVDADLMDISWEDSLKKEVQTFWESIDEYSE